MYRGRRLKIWHRHKRRAFSSSMLSSILRLFLWIYLWTLHSLSRSLFTPVGRGYDGRSYVYICFFLVCLVCVLFGDFFLQRHIFCHHFHHVSVTWILFVLAFQHSCCQFFCPWTSTFSAHGRLVWCCVFGAVSGQVMWLIPLSRWQCRCWKQSLCLSRVWAAFYVSTWK